MWPDLLHHVALCHFFLLPGVSCGQVTSSCVTVEGRGREAHCTASGGTGFCCQHGQGLGRRYAPGSASGTPCSHQRAMHLLPRAWTLQVPNILMTILSGCSACAVQSAHNGTCSDQVWCVKGLGAGWRMLSKT